MAQFSNKKKSLPIEESSLMNSVAAVTGAITGETLSGKSVAESAANGTVVGTVHATDSLSGAVFTFALLDNAGGRFAIDSRTGVITVADGSLLNFEAATSHGIKVQVTDQTGASLTKSFTIGVNNVNEAPTDETLAGGSVVANSANGTVVGTVHGLDPDAGSVLTYSLANNANGAFAINSSTGVITVAKGSLLTTATSLPITVRVKDQGGRTFDKTFNIAVTAPLFVAANEHAVATEDSALSISAASLIADSSNPSGRTLSVKSVGNASHGTVSLANGNITFVPAANFSGIAKYDYTLTDSSGHTSTATVTVDVAPVADTPILAVTSNGLGGSVSKQGGEFLVNTTTFGGQFFPSVATFANGGYVIAWTDTSFINDDFGQVRAQVFDANGHKVGAEFRVNTTTDGEQRKPQVSVLADGSFVVIWEGESDSGGDASAVGVRGQMFQANGTKLGGEFLVNTTTQGTQDDPSVAALANGGFVVTWEDNSGVGGDSAGFSIKAQLFDAGGHKVGGEFLVNTITKSDQDLVSVAALKSGGFVVTWQDNSFLNNDDTRSGSIKAQMFDANGAKVGAELLVDTKGVNFANDVAHVTGLSNGGFVVTWEASANAGADTDDSSIQLQIFDANGRKVGNEVEVNTSGVEYQRAPVVTELSNGNIVVAWKDESEENGDASGASIKAQVLDAQGNRIGGEFLVNTNTLNDQNFPSIAALPNGSFIVTWTDDSGAGGDAQDDSVKAQIFSLGGSTAPNTAAALHIASNLTDADGSETLALSVSNIPVGATLSDGVHSFTATAGNTSVDVSTWSFANLTVTPPLNFIGDFQVTVNATSTDHAASTTGVATDSKTISQTIDIFVTPGQITGETLMGGSVAENAVDGTIVGALQGIDTLPGVALTYALLDNAGGRFAIDANTGNITVANGSLLDFEAATSHSVKVQVADVTGQTFVKSFNIAVTNVNEAPTNETLTGASVVGGAANGTVVGAVHGIDPDAGAVLTYALVDNANGAFAINANTGVITVADGTKLDFASATSRAIDVRVTDQGGLSFDKTFNITVVDPAQQIVAANEKITVNEDHSAVITLAALTNDSTHPSGATLSVTAVGNPHNGTVSITTDGNIAYQPKANFSGTDTFSYTLTDGNGHSSTATVTVDVNPVADAPNLSASTAGGSGGVARVGGETQVNTTEAGGQFLSSIASDANGNYVIVWADTSFEGLGSAPRTDFTQIRGQYYDRNGNKVGGEFQVSSDRTVGQNNPKVSMLSNGDFAVVWQTEGASSVGSDRDGTGVKGQVFSADGKTTPKMVGTEFQVNSGTAGDQGTTSVAGLGDGRFVAVWQDNSADDGNIRMEIFQDSGTGTPVAVVQEFTANTVTLGAQQLPSVAALKGVNDGSYVAVWNDYGVEGQHSTRGDGSFSGTVIARMFDRDGHPLSPELVVNAKNVDKFNDVAQVVGLRNGGFVVSWEAGEQVDPQT